MSTDNKSEEIKMLEQQLQLMTAQMSAQIKIAEAQLDAARNPKPSLVDQLIGGGLRFIGWYIFGFIALLFILAAIGKG